MLDKIKKLFAKKNKEYVSHIKFRAGIQALAMETYKDVTILYISRKTNKEYKDPEDTDIIYHIFYKNDFYDGEAETEELVQELAHSDIDSNFSRFK